MIIPKPFYRGFPPDGMAGAGTSSTYVTTFDLGAQVPSYKKWKIEEITVCNLTQVEGYYSVAIFPDTVTNLTVQVDMAAMNTGVPPRSIAGGATYIALGAYLAYSQPVPPASTVTMPIVAWATSNEKLWAGVYPGQNILLGAGGMCLTISGLEYRD